MIGWIKLAGILSQDVSRTKLETRLRNLVFKNNINQNLMIFFVVVWNTQNLAIFLIIKLFFKSAFVMHNVPI